MITEYVMASDSEESASQEADVPLMGGGELTFDECASNTCDSMSSSSSEDDVDEPKQKKSKI